MTTIAILGNGRVGGGLAGGLTRAGHQVKVADRSPGSAADAARTAQIVINATPGAGSLERLTALREELQGKILVDVSNATVDGPDGLPADLLYPGSSLAERLQRALPGTRVVKTLNTMLYPVMTAARRARPGAHRLPLRRGPGGQAGRPRAPHRPRLAPGVDHRSRRDRDRAGHRGRDPVRAARDPVQRIHALRDLGHPLTARLALVRLRATVSAGGLTFRGAVSSDR
ncbi:NAD(P)-binding domain-containing protein [Actinoallomurus spadix]|uniref:Pyrroline-5-carboxylate reductase catalytic N-terminal domain-containing protein n=1 Tax=Actinoallomurus spadix TaxID=79912 RepID=A0ABN0X3Y8_9ACTN|nr:NAD(P)-binding domain-containing protein [Actinoallomurus spadix]MCO5991590.1 NAD(P)-binding domain-containing protein [Actinoallomurus spadix]